jgi:hypothetical protein
MKLLLFRWVDDVWTRDRIAAPAPEVKRESARRDGVDGAPG